MNYLDAWANRIAAQTRRYEAARLRLTHVGGPEVPSLGQRVSWWFWGTPAQREVNAAYRQIQSMTHDAQAYASAWVPGAALSALHADGAVIGRHQVQAQRLAREKARLVKPQGWLALANDALAKLETAQERCEDAASAEAMDMCSSSKLATAISFSATSDAADAIEEAKEALLALAGALPSRVGEAAIEAPTDKLDSVLDIAFDPGFDLLSWVNLVRLDEAERQCEAATTKLLPFIEQLRGVVRAIEGRVAVEADALREIERPYLESACAQVPRAFSIPIPAQVLSDLASQASPQVLGTPPPADQDSGGDSWWMASRVSACGWTVAFIACLLCIPVLMFNPITEDVLPFSLAIDPKLWIYGLAVNALLLLGPVVMEQSESRPEMEVSVVQAAQGYLFALVYAALIVWRLVLA